MDQLTTQFSILEKTIFEKPLDAKKTIDSQFAKIQRGKLMPANYEQIKFNTIDDISLVSKTFCFNIDIQNIHYECMFNHNNKSKYLYVIYNGWKGSNPLPQFNRWSYQFFFDGSYLGIEDPMYYKYKDIPLGWYYGDTDISYIEKSLSIVKKICSIINTPYENIIFLGSSGGGYAAFYASTLMKNSLSISINPQIYIQNYVGAKTFSRITNIDINSYDKLNRNNPAAMVRMQQDSSHVIICNISDKHHYEKHIVKLASELNIPLKYGLSSKENVLIWTFDALGGHQTFETISIYSAIDYIAKKFKETTQITRDMANLAITTNIFWKDFYAERNKNITLQETKNILVLKEECALTADKDTQERTIHINIPQNKTHNYNHTRLEINKNSINTIKISSKSITSSAKSFSILIYNFSKKCILHQKNYTLDADITFNFIINDTEDDVAICIYAGLCGQTKGHTFSATVELLEKSLLQKTFSIDETHDEESLNNESKAVEEIAEQYTAQQVKTDPNHLFIPYLHFSINYFQHTIKNSSFWRLNDLQYKWRIILQDSLSRAVPLRDNIQENKISLSVMKTSIFTCQYIMCGFWGR